MEAIKNVVKSSYSKFNNMQLNKSKNTVLFLFKYKNTKKLPNYSNFSECNSLLFTPASYNGSVCSLSCLYGKYIANRC